MGFAPAEVAASAAFSRRILVARTRRLPGKNTASVEGAGERTGATASVGATALALGRFVNRLGLRRTKGAFGGTTIRTFEEAPNAAAYRWRIPVGAAKTARRA